LKVIKAIIIIIIISGATMIRTADFASMKRPSNH